MEVLKDMGEQFRNKEVEIHYYLNSEEWPVLCSTCKKVVKEEIFYLALDCGDGLRALCSFRNAPTDEKLYVCPECRKKEPS